MTQSAFVRRRIQLWVFLDESYLVVLRRLRTQLILHLYAPNWSMPVVHGTLTRSAVTFDKIEMVQHCAARFVYNDYSRYSHVSPMIKALEWDSLEYRRLNNQVFIFYKIYKGLVRLVFLYHLKYLAIQELQDLLIVHHFTNLPH